MFNMVPLVHLVLICTEGSILRTLPFKGKWAAFFGLFLGVLEPLLKGFVQ